MSELLKMASKTRRRRRRPSKLDPYKNEVMALAKQGYSNGAIAELLNKLHGDGWCTRQAVFNFVKGCLEDEK